MSEHHHHHHHDRRDESPRREDREEYYVEGFERPPSHQQEYGAYPPGPYGAPAGPYGSAPGPYGGPPGPYGNASYGVQQEGYGAPQGPYGSYGQPSGNDGPPSAVANVQTTEYYQEQRFDAEGYEHSQSDVRRHKREEEVAGVGALAAGTFAMVRITALSMRVTELKPIPIIPADTNWKRNLRQDWELERVDMRCTSIIRKRSHRRRCRPGRGSKKNCQDTRITMVGLTKSRRGLTKR